jgi:hypothetical protein
MYIYLDTETTGNNPDDRLCQIAFNAEDSPAVSGLFNPCKPTVKSHLGNVAS